MGLGEVRVELGGIAQAAVAAALTRGEGQGYAPEHWREVSQYGHLDHAKRHVEMAMVLDPQWPQTREHLEHAITRCVMVLALLEVRR